MNAVKKCHAQAKAHNSILPKYLSSLDTTLHDVLKEVVANNYVKLNNFDDSIRILDPILINLHEEHTLYDFDDGNDEYETIDIDIDLPNMLSSQLTLTPSIENFDSHKDLCLELTIIPTMLDIVPLASYPSFLNDIK